MYDFVTQNQRLILVCLSVFGVIALGLMIAAIISDYRRRRKEVKEIVTRIKARGAIRIAPADTKEK